MMNGMMNGMLTGGGQDTTIHQKYFNLFPDIFLKRNTDTTGNDFFTFSYNRRITRPSYFDLNPYKYYIDNYSVVVGNPYLKPQFTNSFELGYTLRQKYYFSLVYSETKDIINQVIENDPNTELMTILDKNTGSNTVYSATFNVPVQITGWWNTSNNLLLTYTKAVAPEFNISKASFLFQTEQDFTITPTLSTSLNVFYTPSVLQGNMISGRMSEVDWGVQKDFFHK